MTTQQATWAKQDGQWCISVAADYACATGGEVRVYRRDGTHQDKILGECIHKDSRGKIYEVGRDPPNYKNHTCRMSGCSQSATRQGYCAQCAFDEFDD